MTKRILSFVLVLAMLVSVLPIYLVSAEVSDASLTKHTHTQDHACSAQCSGAETWIAWDNGAALPTTSGHYYLTKDVQLTAAVDTPAGTDITICLNGYNIRSKANTRVGLVYGKLTIADCTAYELDGQYICGSVVGSTAGDGAVYGIRRGGTFVLEGGRLTGGTTTGTGGGGALYTQKGTSAGPGGMVYMYGGEISGNNGHNGGALCIGGGDSGCVPSAFYMYGGKITGNSSRNIGGGVQIVNRSVMEIYGGTITGNTSAGSKGAAVYMDGAASKLTVGGSVQMDEVYFINASNAGLKVKELSNGTEISVTAAATELSKIVSLASGANQQTWSAHWLSVNGEPVSMVDGAFVAGHYHGGVKYEPWTGSDNHNTLPSSAKNYYLANDIVRNTNGGAITIAAGTTQHLCLNGHTITHRNPANRLYNILGNFTLEDCSAYTDGQGNYQSGGITYDGADLTRTFGNCFSVQRGGVMTMTGGQIYGFHSSAAANQDSVPVYVQGAQTSAKAVFNMRGGQIHSNTTNANGAAIRMTKASANAATENFSQVNISGGKIWGNTTTTNGGAVAVSGDELNITGGVIENNTAVKGAVYVSGAAKLSVSGNSRIYDNQGGNLYLADQVMIGLGALTGGKIGVTAAQGNRDIATGVSNDPTSYMVSDDDQSKLIYENGTLYLGAGHAHGIDGKAGTDSWSRWTSTTSLPTEAGNYYLTENVQLAGTFTLTENVNLCLNGKTVTAASGKRILAVGAGATLAITDCCASCGTITGGSNNYGAAFNVLRGGVLKLYNGKLSGNHSGNEGGAVYVQVANETEAGGKFMMYGGEISGNSAKSGGAICLAGSDVTTSQAAFAMYGGVIENNTAVNGGAIYTYKNSHVAIADGRITGNKATGVAGGIYVCEDIGDFRVQGAAFVSGNKLGEQNSNIYLLGEEIITVSGLTDGAMLGVSAKKITRPVTNQQTEDISGYFTRDDNDTGLVYRDGCVCIVSGHIHGVDGMEGDVEWTKWTATNALPTEAGNYYLTENVQLTDTFTLTANVNLCLNGKTVTAAEGKRIAAIGAGATLAITDCCETCGTITGGSNNYGAAFNVLRGGALELYKGKLSGNHSGNEGGAVYVQAANETEVGGKFTMYGGEISGNSAKTGGAVALAGSEIAENGASFVMLGGVIENNTAENGGAIYAYKNTNVSITNGKISANTATSKAGGIYIREDVGSFAVSGATVVTGNKLGEENSNIYLLGDEIITVSGLTEGAKLSVSAAKVGRLITDAQSTDISGYFICDSSDNKISFINGGVYLSTTHVHGIDGENGQISWIKWTSATSLPTVAGNYYLTENVQLTDTFTLTANVNLCLNGKTVTAAEGKRIGAIGAGATLAITDCCETCGTITGGSNNYGAAFNVLRGGALELYKGKISGNHSGNEGGAVYVQAANETEVGGKFTMYGGEISGNSAKSGGAVVLAGSDIAENGASFVMLGGVIENNTAENGGAIYAYKNTNVSITNGKISANTATSKAGGIYIREDVGSFTVSGATVVSGNKLGEENSNIYLLGSETITVSGLTEGAQLGISASKVGRAITQQGSVDVSAYFASDDADNKISFRDGCVVISSGHVHGVDGKNGDVEWVKWTSATSLPTAAGNYYLAKDVHLTGTVAIKTDVNLCLNGKTITAAEGKRAVTVALGGNLVITDCCENCGTITGGTNDYGAAFNVNRGATLTMYAGKITGNVSGNEGGAVYVQAASETEIGGKFTMYGGEISGNSAKTGGAVSLAGSEIAENGATFAMYGGLIENNTATTGGAVYTRKNARILLGGDAVITGNSANTAGGIYVCDGAGDLIVSGSVVVKGNLAKGKNSNIYLAAEEMITVENLTKGAQLFVSAAKVERAIVVEATQEQMSYFFCDGTYRMLTCKENKIFLEISDEHIHCTCYSQTEGCDHENVKWQAWESETRLPTESGYYYLLSDIQLTGRLTVATGKDVHICLNGKTVTAPENNRLALVQAEASLSLTDCEGAGKLTGGNRTYGGAVNVNRGGVFNLYGGIITGNQSPQNKTGLGGAIYGQPGSTLNIYGGTISGNSAYMGGAIYMAEDATGLDSAKLTIYGGTISGNSAGYETLDEAGKTLYKGGNGAAIYASGNAIVTMLGGTISNHNGIAYGSTVYLNNATGKFVGGKITDNISRKDGGALYAVRESKVEIGGSVVISNNAATNGAGGGFGGSGKSQFTMTGGTVSGNYAIQGGGAIMQSGASLTMTGGTFAGNESKQYGGAIYVSTPNTDGTLSSMYLQGGTITGNKSGNAAGGVYCNKGYLEMTGGTISKNETANFGCGLYYFRATGKAVGGTITENVSGKDGTGIYVFAGAVEIGGDIKITNNTSLKGAGGGLGFTKESNSKLTGGTITGNTAGNAGGIIVQGKAHLTMTGGYVANNTTKGNGGGVYVNKSSMDFYGGTIAYNTTPKTGAGLFANNSTIRFGGTSFRNNDATGNGGGAYLNKGTATFTGGTFANNTSQRYGGGLYLYYTETTMRNTTFSDNFAVLGSGAIHGYSGTLTAENVTISGNKTDSACGGLCVTKFCELTMTDCLVEGNEANNAGGLLIQNWAKATLNNVKIYENKTCDGSGLYVFSNVEVTMNGGEIARNLAYTKTDKYGQIAGGNAAGVYVNTNVRTQTGKSKLYLNDVTICDNVAQANGGGVYVDMQMLCYLDGCTIQNNTAAGSGAGIYQAVGSGLQVRNTKILANTAADTGSAIYAGSDFVLENSTITGNKTTNGAAVYIAPARYDGHSFVNAVVKFGGDLIICDNEGTMDDLYIDEGTAIAVTLEGFGKNTKMHVQLHSGVLTNTILGVYDYEGGDLHYTLTYGERSLTEPEFVEVTTGEQEQTPAQTQTNTQKGGNALLYVGVGAAVLAVLIVVVLILKKKKAGVPADKN